ncbi:hypothetical protein BGZ99_007000, partial [Dissophora globulifera]
HGFRGSLGKTPCMAQSDHLHALGTHPYHVPWSRNRHCRLCCLPRIRVCYSTQGGRSPPRRRSPL